MAQVQKIDANITGLRYSEELSLGTVDPAAFWFELEPNSYSDFGQQVTNVARVPIVSDRQKKKGVLTDLDASGGFSADLTQEALPDLGQGVFFAAIRDKNEITGVPVVDGAAEEFEPIAGGDGYVAGDLMFAQGFDSAANNGLHEVSGVPVAGVIPVTSDLTTDAAQSGTLRRVGFQFAAGDLDVTAAGDFATLTTVTKDLTELGLIPGEWIFLGGDVAGDQFDTAANNGFKRVRSVTANALVIDKSDATMVLENNGDAMKMFFAPRLLKNESDPTLIVRRSYQVERTLGAPDDALPAEVQSEYLVGAVPSQLQLNVATADKMTFDLSFMGTDMEFRTGATGVKAGTRPALLESEAYNSSSDVTRINMSIVSDVNEAPTPLFICVQDLSITVDNTLSPNKCVGTFGAFEITAGMFSVSGSLTAFFGNIDSQQAIRQNDDISIDAHMVKSNQGISLDMPLLTIGDGRPNVEADTAITLPLTFEAASGAKVDSTLDHTLLMEWWDYLPNAAAV
jgi:hypothetical protein